MSGPFTYFSLEIVFKCLKYALLCNIHYIWELFLVEFVQILLWMYTASFFAIAVYSPCLVFGLVIELLFLTKFFLTWTWANILNMRKVQQLTLLFNRNSISQLFICIKSAYLKLLLYKRDYLLSQPVYNTLVANVTLLLWQN